MSDPRHTSSPPTTRQLRYLRDLAMQRGESFAYPTSAAQASAEIDHLKGRRRPSRNERRYEDLEIRRALHVAKGDNAMIRRFEVTGYGSTATWR